MWGALDWNNGEDDTIRKRLVLLIEDLDDGKLWAAIDRQWAGD